jgi:DNA (cytosine-5)-methyltransferase 1
MDGYWLSEPDIPRTAKGIKNRVARLKALGNCVVPMQAYPIFRAIVESEALHYGRIGGFEHE